ncbi:MAG: nucleotidyltransferase [Candidatus Portnoybacteria bacterium CG23_combo_of_CG06-09_8_20_14_all_37_13]|uniref:Nucleotidyltransferase n=1 Tax=Candidatus Portnoybacteria bacterium CG23_combo_of_CG06-09_8_20_14_all_37_13 TaxID=1974819 RepID=A0A2G9YDG0_9BACT|nr:MAG: nucleotidyltransferase [Candidatus Portnoybacteria bacterium CG23_combo_of_CG06-09_8_20_14_all_37_13]
MKNSQVKRIIQENKSIIEEQFGVKNIGIFGSYVRGEQNKDSDIDILVEFAKPISFFSFLALEEYLKKQLGTPVDLVTKNALKPIIGRQILKEVSYL